MPVFIEQKQTAIGFGISRAEAKEDLYNNACMVTLANDTKGVFAKRREELHPWMPLPNMLHISGVGCLLYEDMKITETSTNKTIVVAATGASIFRYLSVLFEDKLSYTDIICVLREEIDTFFLNISEEFTPISSLQVIQVQKESDDFIPSAIYSTSYNFVIGCVEDAIGIKYSGEDCYYVAQVNKSSEQIDSLYRLLYRTGYILVNDKVVEL